MVFIVSFIFQFRMIKYVETDNIYYVLDLIYQQTNKLRVEENKNGESFSTFSVSVPRAGGEPARVAPLVFETSASTDSAIWAFARAKVQRVFYLCKYFCVILLSNGKSL